MADTELGDLTAVTSLGDTDLLFVGVGGNSRKITGANLKASDFTELNLVGGTVTADTPILNATQTWNNAGVTFNALDLNITDTASNTFSNFINFKRGGVEAFRVSKFGLLRLLNAAIQLDPLNSAIWIANDLGQFQIGTSIPNTILLRDGANDTLAMRRTTNAQTLRLYETFTNSSNYSRLTLSAAASGPFVIAAQAEGTGTQRDIMLSGANRAAYSETAADIAAALVSHGIMAAA